MVFKFVTLLTLIALTPLASGCPLEVVASDPEPVYRLLYPLSKTIEPTRQIGVMLTLANGTRLVATGGSISCQHDDLIKAIEAKYQQPVKSIAWGGELLLKKDPTHNEFLILNANETSSYLAKQLKIPSDSSALQAALQKVPGLKWNLPPGTSSRYDPNNEHLHSSMKSRHSINNRLTGPQMGVEILVMRLGSDDTEDFESTRQSLGKLAKNDAEYVIDWIEGLRNDGVISNSEAKEFLKKFEDFAEGRPMQSEDFYFLDRNFQDFRKRLQEYQDSLSENLNVWIIP